MDQDAIIKRFVKRLVKAVKPEAVLLIGSRARGDATEESDFDIIVIAKEFEGMKGARRFGLVSQNWDYSHGLGLDVLTFTPGEFIRAMPKSFIIRDALKDAQVISGNSDVLQEYKSQLA